MNAIESLNKYLGIAFGVFLAGFLGYRAYVWRSELPKKLNERLKHRIAKMSEDPRYQMPISEMKFPKVEFNMSNMQGFNPGSLTVQPSNR